MKTYLTGLTGAAVLAVAVVMLAPVADVTTGSVMDGVFVNQCEATPIDVDTGCHGYCDPVFLIWIEQYDEGGQCAEWWTQRSCTPYCPPVGPCA